jgi:hypothetical protein
VKNTAAPTSRRRPDRAEALLSHGGTALVASVIDARFLGRYASG